MNQENFEELDELIISVDENKTVTPKFDVTRQSSDSGDQSEAPADQ